MFTRRDRALLRVLHNEVTSLNDRIATLLRFIAQVPSSAAMVGDEFFIVEWHWGKFWFAVGEFTEHHKHHHHKHHHGHHRLSAISLTLTQGVPPCS